MQIINPEVTLLTEKSPLKRVEIVGRVCTDSYDKMTEDSALKFCQMLNKRKHGTPFEHVRVAIGHREYVEIINRIPVGDLMNIYGLNNRIDMNRKDVRINGRDFLAIGGTLEELAGLPLADDFATLHFVIDIGISRELCRHRQMSFMERSTRYVNLEDGIEIIRPLPFEWAKNDFSIQFLVWEASCRESETTYQTMIAHDCSAQEARSVLPLSTRTDLFVTGTYKQWNDVFSLRLDKAAHPSMRYIMDQAKELIKENL